MSPHVLIVGAGLGGLTLAQCLRKQGASFEIFERDIDDQSRAQGWAIGLHSMLDELQSSMPSDLPDLRESVHHLSPLKLNTQLCMYIRGDRVGVQDTPETPVLRANRARLRGWLSTNLPIHWGKQLQHIEETGDGKICLHFADGTNASGDVLVGADGVHSVVREHVLQRPNDEVLNLIPTSTIIGEVHLSGAAFERQLSLGHSCYVVAAPSSSARLFVGLQQANDDGNSGEYYWFFMTYDEEACRPNHWLRTASRQEKLDYAKKTAAEMDSKFTEIMELTPASGIKDTFFTHRDAEIRSLPTGRVALVGDAAHPMTPFRGEGGCHAITDALNLSKVLGKIEKGENGDIAAAIEGYHAEVLERGSNAVLSSRNAHKTMGQKPPVGWGYTVVPIPEERIVLSALK
ncbi:uncharacterized protein JN550_002488 [Neoarthrinium moseri]|uniref:uncharacterized protein n=1 Tax=Neoarthrinium moseri TaxID=1658444 RepID=UPI001FDCB12D|nr:uncharacterized protein JN550_002488 [Neoarthrinium moseri]KAI1875059.1 hypothetical protein JN550_002488 [Neoarthrinium moseri]